MHFYLFVVKILIVGVNCFYLRLKTTHEDNTLTHISTIIMHYLLKIVHNIQLCCVSNKKSMF